MELRKIQWNRQEDKDILQTVRETNTKAGGK